jgi:hypothetical protein
MATTSNFETEFASLMCDASIVAGTGRSGPRANTEANEWQHTGSPADRHPGSVATSRDPIIVTQERTCIDGEVSAVGGAITDVVALLP